ncbi:MAG: hypothetical protein ACFFC9_07700 [Promethearchaeota archaeon]
MKIVGKHRKKIEKRIIISFILLITFNLLFTSNLFIAKNNLTDNDKNNSLRTSASEVKGKPLLINQYSTITNSFFPSSLPTNVSFTLFEDWISQNVNIEFEGVSQNMQRVYNGGFDINSSGWLYKSNNPTEYINQGWQSAKGNPSGSMEIKLDNGLKNEGDFGYFEQNVTIPEIPTTGLISKLSTQFFVPTLLNYPENVSLYLAIVMGSVEKNVTYDFQSYLIINTWVELIMNFDSFVFGEIESSNATIRVGIYTEAQTTINPFVLLGIDNVKLNLWTMPNEPNLVKVFDNEFGDNYTYTNSSYGKGHTVIDVERTREPTDDVIFTIFSNKSDVLDFFIYNITIYSSVVRSFNTSISEVEGCICTFEDNIIWETDINFSQNYKYGEIWGEIVKPTDWDIIHIYDRDMIDRVGSCLDVGIGSNKTTIPLGIMTPSNIERPWKIVANSENYMLQANMTYWNGTTYLETSNITNGDMFQINVTLNNSIPLLDTTLNCTIKYPNGTIFYADSKIISSYNPIFGNFTAGNNMTVGQYQVIVEWINNQSYLFNDKAGFKTFEFVVWHHTNLTAIDSYIEAIAGEPLLIKVKFIDYDLNFTIEFADINYSSTFGQFGTMVYIGSGIYFTEIDTSSLGLGDYYFSFSANKSFYENHTISNLIHLKIIPEQLALDLSHSVIETDANSIVSCRVNVTGAISKILLSANISTNWFNSYNVTDHENGTYTLDFSTNDIPTQGYLESYTIEIFANKTGYGDANEFLTLLVHPIPTIANVNTSLVSVYQNDIVQIRANYTDANSDELITGANCSVSWQGSSLIAPISNQFDITLDTAGLIVDYYTVLITFKRAGYETAFTSIAVVVNEREVNISVSINSVQISENSKPIDAFFQQQINISARVCTVIGGTYLSGGIITLISDNYEENLTEAPSTFFNTSLILDGAYFDDAINNIFLRFEQTNYSTKIFAFQLNIQAQNIELTAQIDYQDFQENDLLPVFFNQEFHLSCRAYAEIDEEFLSGGIFTLVNGEKEMQLTETIENWYNLSIVVSSSFFSIDRNNVYLRFEKNNYTTTTFSFKIFVSQIEFGITTVGFENIISGNPGEQVTIQLNITEQGSPNSIENATVSYSWDFDIGFFTEKENGIYESIIDLPRGYTGNYQIKILVSKEDSIYKTTEFSFFIEIRRIEPPNLLLWLVIISLIGISGILGTLSLRSYVILPKKRKKKAELLDKIQVYKDVKNIEALMLVQKSSGLPIYTQEIGIFENDDDSIIISGFIQAITNFSDIVIKKEFNKYNGTKTNSAYSKYIIELDFNMFQLLVCDYDTIRILIFLREKSSERLKKQLYLLSIALNSQYADKFTGFTGEISLIKNEIIYMLNQFLFLHYAEKFKINEDNEYIGAIVDSGELKKMEKRLFNVIISIAKRNKEFNLRDPIETIHEKNEDVVLEALDTLIKKKLIIPTYSAGLKEKK